MLMEIIMSLSTYQKSMFPYFGGKSLAAPLVWSLLGDPAHYVEPFFGSGAVLLFRPHPANRSNFSETVNDFDGFIANFWRAMQYDAQATVEFASWPVVEAELHARHIAIIQWMRDGNAERLAGDVQYYDARIAGYWLYGICAWIGSGWGHEQSGPWWPDADGRLVKRSGNSGVTRKLPHVSADGQGVHHCKAREPGVTRQLPRVGADGQGVHHCKAREPGVTRKLPHQDEDLADIIEADYAASDEYHPMTMPEIRRWAHWLQARMRHVRVANGDWQRICTSSVLRPMPRGGKPRVSGIFLDPPYKHSERSAQLYREDQDIASDVREWCLQNGNNSQYRIVLAGFAGEGHEILEKNGWSVYEWYEHQLFRSGYGHQQHRERLWASPHCLLPMLPLDALWE
jgi:hypothetical protein